MCVVEEYKIGYVSKCLGGRAKIYYTTLSEDASLY
jgi:hypothetical protein